MRKFIKVMATVLAAIGVSSCGGFEVENTATVDLAGNWMCSIYRLEDGEWAPYYEAEYVTSNTAANVETEMLLTDNGNFWDTKNKVDCSNSELRFGTDGKEYENLSYNSLVKIWNGKVTKDAVTAPGTPTTCDKIEFFIAFDDDDDYVNTYYVVGYRRTGFPEDDDNFIWEWEDLPSAE